jgi:enamine deaminase RidA (YjgF/YER057c/UK114 family)
MRICTGFAMTGRMNIDRRVVFLAGGLAILPSTTRCDVRRKAIHPTESSYAQAHEVEDASRWLFISGQVPEGPGGEVPASFRDQARLAWRNVEAQLAAAGMTLDNLVKVTTFLSDRRYRQENYEVRHEVLAGRTPAITIVICGIYDEAWLLEIEAVAAA